MLCLSVVLAKYLEYQISNLIPGGYKSPDMDKQAMDRDAGRHEVVVLMAVNL